MTETCGKPKRRGSGEERRPGAGVARARLVLVVVLLGWSVVGVFARTGGFGFVEEYDDKQYILANPNVRAGLTWEGVVWAFTSTGYASNWHPLTWLSHMLDVRLFGLNAGAHHVVSVALHAVNGVLLFLVLRGMTGNFWRSAFAAALLALHPLRVESVAWVAARKDVLSLFFALLAIRAWLSYVRRPSPLWCVGTVVALALGLMAKPMIVTLPALLLILDIWPLGRLRPGGERAVAAVGRLVLEKVPLVVLAAGAGLLTAFAQWRGSSIVPMNAVPFPDRLASALVAYVSYLDLTFLPRGLSPFYAYAHLPLLSAPVIRALAILAMVTTISLVQWRRWPWLASGWLWFVWALVPVIGLVQVGDQRMADRYTYLPSIGSSVAIAWWGAALQRTVKMPRPVVAAVGILVLTALAGASCAQVGYWRDGVALFSRALEREPANWIAHNNLGAALRNRHLDNEAFEHFARAVAIRPSFADARYNLGVMLYERNALDAAATQYREAVRFKPDYQEAQCNLGAVLFLLGDREGALRHLREAVRLRPDDPVARRNLDLVLREEGEGR